MKKMISSIFVCIIFVLLTGCSTLNDLFHQEEKSVQAVQVNSDPSMDIQDMHWTETDGNNSGITNVINLNPVKQGDQFVFQLTPGSTNQKIQKTITISIDQR